MKTYWDHTETERAELTSEQVADLLRYEYMEHGIIVPPEPVKPDHKPLNIDTETVYSVQVKESWNTKHIASFRDKANAEALVAMGPMDTDWDSSVGIEYQYLVPLKSVSIEEKSVYKRESLTEVQAELSRRKEEMDAYDDDVKAYKAAITQQEKASEVIWEDWHNRIAERRQSQRIVDTFNDYVKTCDGNEEVAMRFLRKAFLDAQISTAAEQFPDAGLLIEALS